MRRSQLVCLFSLLSLTISVRTGGAERAGSVDLSFDAGPFWSDVSYGVGGYGKVIALALGPDEEIYIGGHFTAFGLPWAGGKNWNGIARLNNDGSLDETFAVPLFDRSMWPSAMNHVDAHEISVEANGTVWAGDDLWLWRFREDGRTNMVPRPEDHRFEAIVEVYPDGRFLGWNFWNSGTVSRFLPNGELDQSLTPFPGRQLDRRLILRDGRLLEFGGAPLLRRRNLDGTVDPTYQSPRFTNGIQTLLEAANGQVYVAEGFNPFSEESLARLVRLNENGVVDENFLPDSRVTEARTAYPIQTLPAPTGIIAMALQADGKLLVAGISRALRPR